MYHEPRTQAFSVFSYLEGEVEVFLYISLIAQQLSQTMSQLLQTDTGSGSGEISTGTKGLLLQSQISDSS